MPANPRLHHVALQCSDKEKAEIFYATVLGLTMSKQFTLSEALSHEIFGIRKAVDVIVYENASTRFEVFITRENSRPLFGHTCIEVESAEEFVAHCRAQGVKPMVVQKQDKQLLFVKDFSGNLFEIKEHLPPAP